MKTQATTKSTFKTLGYKITSNALVVSYENDKGERKKTYTFNCPEANNAKFAEALTERLALSTNEFVLNEAKKLAEKGLLINIKEAKDALDDQLESLIG